MEFLVPKITKSRTQKRRKRLIKNRRRNQRKKLEVRTSKRRKITRDYNNISMGQNVDFSTTMTANAFWENYKVAHDWQHRHNVAWWKSRCIALEHENRALRDKIREQAATCNININNVQHTEKYLPENLQTRNHTDEDEDKYEYEYEAVDEENLEEDDQNLEFHVDEEMMKFLEQSIRHKMELKRIRECEDDKLINDEKNSINIESGEAIINQRINDAKLLYGAASLRILAMETAVQASIDQHKDRAKPHYWPNIPLKP